MICLFQIGAHFLPSDLLRPNMLCFSINRECMNANNDLDIRFVSYNTASFAMRS